MKPKSTDIHIHSVSQSEVEGKHEIGVKCGKACIRC